MENGCLSLWYMVSVIVNGFARGGGVNSGAREPKMQTAPDFIPSSCNRESEKTPILYPGNCPNLKTY